MPAPANEQLLLLEGLGDAALLAFAGTWAHACPLEHPASCCFAALGVGREFASRSRQHLKTPALAVAECGFGRAADPVVAADHVAHEIAAVVAPAAATAPVAVLASAVAAAAAEVAVDVGAADCAVHVLHWHGVAVDAAIVEFVDGEGAFVTETAATATEVIAAAVAVAATVAATAAAAAAVAAAAAAAAAAVVVVVVAAAAAAQDAAFPKSALACW